MVPSKLAIPSIFLALIFFQIRAETPRLEYGPGVWPGLFTSGGALSPEENEIKENNELIKEKEKVIQPNLDRISSMELQLKKNDKLIKEKEKEIQHNLDRISWMELQLKKNNELIKQKEKVIQHNLDRISSMELQLKKNNELIKEKEKVIQQKSDIISSLRSEIESLQKNGSLVEQQVGKAQARADELEKKVNELEQKLQSQRKEKEDLESRANEAEEKINGLLSEIKNTGKTNDEQETKIRKTEHALEVKVAEVEMWKAKFEATLKAKVLNEVNEDRINEAHKKIDDLVSKIENVNELEKELQSQSHEKGDLKDRVNEAVKKIDDLISKIKNVNEFEKELQLQRNEKGDVKDWLNEVEKKIDDLLSKIGNALDKKAQAEKWAEPHVETTKTKWIPAIKEQWLVVKDTVELHVISLSNTTMEVYEVSKTTIAPHVIKAQEVVYLYFQEAKKFSEPYVDLLTTVTKRHVDKAVIACAKFLKSASTYHHQVQGTVKDLLKRHELTRPLAIKELEWFAASALVALLIIILFRIFSSLFCTKTKKPVPGTNHARRNAKRGHPEK